MRISIFAMQTIKRRFSAFGWVVLAVAVCMVPGGCGTAKKSKYKRLPGTWQVSPITIDGSNKDWPSPYPEYDGKAALGYCVSNDENNLYVTVETGDLATQLKILRNGLTVWIDKSGKKEESTAINFPLPADYEKRGGTAGEGKRPSGGHWQQNGGTTAGGTPTTTDAKQQRTMMLQERVRADVKSLKGYSLQGFKACNMEFPLLERDSCGIVVRIDVDSDNEMVWEAVIPFKSFYYRNKVSRMDKGKPMSICIETVGSKRPATPAGGGGGGQGGGGGFRPNIGMGGMGGMRMGMGGGGGRGGSRGGGQHSAPDTEMENLYKSTKTYKVFGVAWDDGTGKPAGK
jgi:hypothetical protein